MDIKVTDIGDFKLLKLTGTIDWEKAKELDNTLKELFDKGYLNLVIDLDEVLFLCSGGLGALAYGYSIINRSNGKLYLIFSTKYIEYLFETISFNYIFKDCIFNSLEEFKEKIIGKKVGAS